MSGINSTKSINCFRTIYTWLFVGVLMVISSGCGSVQPAAPPQEEAAPAPAEEEAAEYPEMEITDILPGNEDLAQSRDVALDYLRSHPDTNGVFTVTGIATPGVVEAVKQLGLEDKVVVTGLGVPSLIRPYIKDGSLKEAVLWDPVKLGYATIYMVKAQLDGTLKPGSKTLSAGELGELQFMSDDTILLGDALIFTKDNIDDYEF